jgi:hypothetical protein
MARLFPIMFFVVLVGCDREAQHTRGDLTPYLQWTQGTPVIVHLATTKPSGEIIKNATAQGKLVKVTPDALFISDGLGITNGFDKDLVLWAEKDTRK